MRALTVVQSEVLKEALKPFALMKAARSVCLKMPNVLDVVDEAQLTLLAMSIWDAQMDGVDIEDKQNCVLSAVAGVRRQLKSNCNDNIEEACRVACAMAVLCFSLQAGTEGTEICVTLCERGGHEGGLLLEQAEGFGVALQDGERERLAHWLFCALQHSARPSVNIEKQLYNMDDSNKNEVVETLKEMLLEQIRQPRTVNVEGDYVAGNKQVFEADSNPTFYNVVGEEGTKSVKDKSGSSEEMSNEEFMELFKLTTPQRTKFYKVLEMLHKSYLNSQTNQPKINLEPRQMKVIAACICEAVGISQKWKPFERLWGVSGLKGLSVKSLGDFRKEVNGVLASV